MSIPIITSLAEAPEGDAWLQKTPNAFSWYIPIRDGKRGYFVTSIAGWQAHAINADGHRSELEFPFEALKLKDYSLYFGASPEEAIAEHLKTQPFGEVRLVSHVDELWSFYSKKGYLFDFDRKQISARHERLLPEQLKAVNALEALVLDWWERGPESRIGKWKEGRE